MRYLTVSIVLALALFAAPQAHAQTVPTATYPAGWNMVGGPTGTDFSSASDLDAYINGNYVAVSNRTGISCVGFWARFPTSTTVTLPVALGPTQTCTLASGWDLVGNPFSGPADVPSGVTAYYWDRVSNAYDVVSTIPQGAAVWIYSPAASTVTLTYHNATPPGPDFDYAYPAVPNPVTMRVGQTLELTNIVAAPVDMVANSTNLQLIDAGLAGDISCTTTCVVNLLNQYWTYKAVAAGTVQITVTPQCLHLSPPCSAPVGVITVNILP